MNPAESNPGRLMEPSRLELWCDRIIVALLFAIVICAPLLMGALRTQDFFWIELLTACGAAVAAARLLFARNVTIFLPPLFWVAATFTVYAVIRYWTADLEYVARKELLWVLTYLAILFLTLNHLRDPKRMIALFVVLLVLAMGMSLFALRQYITGSSQVWHLIRPAYGFRGSGTFIYPNHFAAFLELLLPFGVAVLFLGSFSWRFKIIIAYCTIWIAIGLYVSFSRAGWIASILGLLILLPLILRNKKSQILGFGMVVILLIAVLGWELKTGQIQKRFAPITGEGQFTDLGMRLKIWNAARNVWLREPLFGAGPGHFDYRFRPYRHPIMQMRPGRAHNDYLDLLADWGIAGAVPLLVGLLLFFWPAAREWFSTFKNANLPISESRLIILTGAAGLISILAHALVDYQMHLPANAILTVVILAAAVTQLHVGEPSGRRFHRYTNWLAACALLALAAVIGFQACKAVKEQALLDFAAEQSGPDKIATLKKAFALEPTNFETARWIGESYRLWSWDGDDNYKRLADDAIQWFAKAAVLNPFDPFNPLGIGMCLDWLKQHEAAEPYYLRAVALDPNNYYIFAQCGWHFFQKGDYAEAKRFLLKSWALNPIDNPIALNYLRLNENRLKP